MPPKLSATPTQAAPKTGQCRIKSIRFREPLCECNSKDLTLDEFVGAHPKLQAMIDKALKRAARASAQLQKLIEARVERNQAKPSLSGGSIQ